jgi:hypothetical protein
MSDMEIMLSIPEMRNICVFLYERGWVKSPENLDASPFKNLYRMMPLLAKTNLAGEPL